MTELFSAEEAAQILGLQVRTVRNYVREGRLPGVRIGKQYRIARADLEAFTAGLGTPGGGEVQDIGQPGGAGVSGPAAEASSIVQVDGIEASDADRLARTVAAASLAAAGQDGPGLRVEPIYDDDRRRLKLIIVGPLAEVSDLLRIIDAFTRQPGSPGAF
jgi:excisionase family DNA binding protein